jgi:hypothetical protein
MAVVGEVGPDAASAQVTFAGVGKAAGMAAGSKHA